MPNLLGATNPVPGYDKTVTNRPSQVPTPSPQLQNVPDPSKVTRADRRSEQQGSGLQNGETIRYSSNLQTFLQRLRETPSMAETMMAIFAGREGTQVLSGMQDGISVEMAKILEMLQMDDRQLLDFLTGQMKAGTRFGGGLFSLLRTAYASAGSENVREDILRFLRSYSDFSSTQHLEGNMLRNLSRMADAMPARWAEQLRNLMAQIENSISAGDRKGTMQLLQKGVFTYMGRYVEQTHDMGTPREMLSLLALDAARYENGSVDKLLELFHRLSGYGTLKNQLQGIDDQLLMKLLRQSSQFSDTPAVRFSDALASAAARALKGEGGLQVQQGFQNLVAALLVNESVYMPLNHYMLPMQWEDRLLFSELWVDPDAEGESAGQGMDPEDGKIMRLLLKVDVQSLGLFDIIVINQKDKVDLQISCPESVAPFTHQIEQAATAIMLRHELKPTRVAVRKMDQPVALTDVFPKIFQGRNGVNVQV